ncbi:MMPL family transporter [Solwaraspora sp. WMMD791]|uniref:MMPL family transporter n=1 Tax=Solwaraspora sp. WMMD791 TaxID=3016086 RepID=UPI002499E32A|nr:MMPL family transporter [Solwaraspora sp. WMMD791]WFE28844.1 MMPL family transporter [Solwaraspora sp. WMMD791]
MKKLARLAVERPKLMVALWLIVIALSVPFAAQLDGALKAGGFSDPRGEAAIGQEVVEDAFREAPNSLLVVLSSTDREVSGAVDTARAAVDRPGVAQLTDYRDNPAWLSADGRTTFIQVGFTSSNTEVQNLVPDLREDVAAAVGDGVDINVTGAPALDYALNVQSKEDVLRAEMIAFPVLFVVLFLVFRSVAAMLVPLVLAGVTLAVTSGLGYFVARGTDLSILYTNIVSMIGLAVAVDYSLFIVKRFREELAEGRTVPMALERTLTTVGHSVMFSGLAVVVALSALFIPRAMSFTSIAFGGVMVTLVAMAVSLTLLPAVLSLLGHRINWGSLRSRRVRTATTGYRSTSVVYRRAGVVLAALVIAFVALGLPATQLNLQVPVASADILPEDDDARQGIEKIQEELGLREMFPIQVVLTAEPGQTSAVLDSVDRIVDQASDDERTADVRAVTTLGLAPDVVRQATVGDTAGLPAEAATVFGALWVDDGERIVTRVLVIANDDPDTTEAHELVENLRATTDSLAGDGVDVRVTGATATGADFDDLVTRSIPIVVGAVTLVTFLILILAFRSVILPLLALAFNAAVVCASLGALALLSRFTSGDTINSVTPLMLFAVMFGLSMDYMVIMISRMRETYAEGYSHREAVLGGLARTAGMVNGAAVIMVAVFASFGSAEISIVRELGITLAIAVVLDAMVVRRLVMPTTLLLLGDRVWGRRRPSPTGDTGQSSAHDGEPGQSDGAVQSDGGAAQSEGGADAAAATTTGKAEEVSGVLADATRR